VTEKPAAVSPFFRAFPSNHIPKATKDVNVIYIYIYICVCVCAAAVTVSYRANSGNFLSYYIYEVN